MLEGTVTYPVIHKMTAPGAKASGKAIPFENEQESKSPGQDSVSLHRSPEQNSLIRGFTVVIQEYQEAFMDEKRFPPSLFQMMRDKIQAMSKPDAKHSFEA